MAAKCSKFSGQSQKRLSFSFSKIFRLINSTRGLYFHFIKRAIAEYLSTDLPYKLSPDDVYLTVGCGQAIELIIKVLARPGANILLPRPGYAFYEALAAANHLEFRLFDLLPEKVWEVDLEGVKALADENTVAMVIINPGNPCGNVFTHQHLKKVG